MKTTSKWLIAALSVSLMVNVFAAGHFFTRDFKRGPGKDRLELSRSLPRGALAAMPEAAREAFKEAIRQSRGDIRAARKAAGEARRDAAAAMERDGTLDEAAIAKNFETLRDLSAKQQAGFEIALISALKVMTPEERQAFAQALRARANEKSKLAMDKRFDKRKGPPKD